MFFSNTSTRRMVSVSCVLKRKNSLPFLFTPLICKGKWQGLEVEVIGELCSGVVKRKMVRGRSGGGEAGSRFLPMHNPTGTTHADARAAMAERCGCLRLGGLTTAFGGGALLVCAWFKLGGRSTLSWLLHTHARSVAAFLHVPTSSLHNPPCLTAKQLNHGCTPLSSVFTAWGRVPRHKLLLPSKRPGSSH